MEKEMKKEKNIMIMMRLKYKREYLSRKINGKGKEYYNNGKLRYEGEYLTGERNGKEKYYNYDSKLEFERDYLTRIRNGKVKENKIWKYFFEINEFEK